ncbi:acetyl-CoA carboxylase biotin carboxyl carrier protein [Enterococcus sp. BWM-S5]|uniref:Biotin carboxyl carrier protein of acetyl-CoA carboxylase n=1 Tax=Enterococcus larvae TaxID=2794352 RepID=A0ABS4CNJ0_9ENTE|nr:acetyl-CoA carboxylase biotin carboxyl carrier protein [Enterococcus larvae]MBP1048138.1 acetyl-CoA carboxylase biotin carboxyl carrier protein [Enterococcus larvae]
MDINEVKELLTQFDGSSLTEFDLREGSFELYMNKNSASQRTVQAQPEVEKTSGQTASVVEAEPVISARPAEAPRQASTEGEEITSPLVGVVYLQPAPDKAMFKSVGDKVKKGEVVCIVEAMKLMNEITATVDGTITEVLVENESIVEYNQPLFRVAKGE